MSTGQSFTIVAVFRERRIAEDARQRLVAEGIGAEAIRIGPDQPEQQGPREGHRQQPLQSSGVLDWLDPVDPLTEEERRWFDLELAGRTAVSVRTDAQMAERVRRILSEYRPVEVGAGGANEAERFQAPRRTITVFTEQSPHIAAGAASRDPALGNAGATRLPVKAPAAPRTARDDAWDEPAIDEDDEPIDDMGPKR
jgi:hypothetical protein